MNVVVYCALDPLTLRGRGWIRVYFYLCQKNGNNNTAICDDVGSAIVYFNEDFAGWIWKRLFQFDIFMVIVNVRGEKRK